MRYVTVAEMQELIDQCTGYSLDFVKCMTREVNKLVETKAECNEHRQPVEPERVKRIKTIIGNTSDVAECKT